MKIRRALISVSDKTGIVELAQALRTAGAEILSTGGTARALREAGLAVKEVSEHTGFPEMLDGRVKTLHPKIHGGLLYIRGNAEHEQQVRAQGIEPIDLVCVNLYPFEATVNRPGTAFEEAIENIDIGGPAMLRSAAKNHHHVAAISSPQDYAEVVRMLAETGELSLSMRRKLACATFSRLSAYDMAIANYLMSHTEKMEAPALSLHHPCGRKLRYGENPQQEAFFYRDPIAAEAALAFAELLNGKEMSFNNYLDGDAAVETAREFADGPAAVVIKHNNPCGCATGLTLPEALQAAWEGDPVSAFGSVIALTQLVDLATAEVLKNRFVEALIAPDFTPEALAYLKNKSKDLRILKLHQPLKSGLRRREVRPINGGLLLQDCDIGYPEQWVVPTETPFPDDKRPLAEFGVRVCKHIKSNAIAIVREYRPRCYALLGMGAGQPNRVDSIRKLALPRARENLAALEQKPEYYGRAPKEIENMIISQAVLVSDAFFPFPDNVACAAEAGIRYLVQPGGSKKDEMVVAECDKYGIAMVFTSVRHFKH